MKQRGFLLLCFFGMIIVLNSCTKVTGEGPMLTELRTPDPFTIIKVSMSAEVFYQQAPELKIELQAQKNILDVIETPVTGDELTVKLREGVHLRSNEQIRIIISGPSVNSLLISGSGNISTLGTYKPETLFLHIKGSGNILIPFLVTRDVDAIINGSGDIRVANGITVTEEVDISGSGSADLLNMTAEQAATNTRGSGAIKLNVSKTLYSTISGSGSVFYKGNPTVHAEISGSGRVVPI